jgi:hypothetical protein
LLTDIDQQFSSFLYIQDVKSRCNVETRTSMSKQKLEFFSMWPPNPPLDTKR